MNTPRVHLLLPVYNSFSYERSDGKRLLPLAINSILCQTFKDFELIILDNQSTDDTPAICREYAKKDPRVRFIVDDRKRFAEEAITELGRLATAPYCMIVNDDDMWDSRYIEEAVAYMDNHPDADLVSGRCLFINPENLLTGFYAPKESEQYGKELSPLKRFVRYANIRNILPIHYGLFKTEVFRSALPYQDFDTLKSNIDNVFMSNFFSKGYQANYCKKLLFYYRRKSRTLNPAKFASNMPALEDPIGIWLFYANHQSLLFSKLLEIACKAGFPERSLGFARISVLVSCTKNSLNLIRWVKQEMQSQGRYAQAKNIDSLEKEYRSKMKGDVLSYGIPESAIEGEKVSEEAFTNWVLRAKKTICLYQDILRFASKESGTAESAAFASKILKSLDSELAWLSSWGKNPFSASDTIAVAAQSESFSPTEIVRDHPLIKKILIVMLSAYLTVRFFPSYARLIRETRNHA